MTITALTAFDVRAGIMKRFSREAEKPEEVTLVRRAWLWKQFQCPEEAVTA